MLIMPIVIIIRESICLVSNSKYGFTFDTLSRQRRWFLRYGRRQRRRCAVVPVDRFVRRWSVVWFSVLAFESVFEFSVEGIAHRGDFESFVVLCELDSVSTCQSSLGMLFTS